MKNIILGVLALSVCAPAAMANEAPASKDVYEVSKVREVNGQRHIEAIRLDGKKKAYVTVDRTGSVSATVDGQPVNAELRGL